MRLMIGFALATSCLLLFATAAIPLVNAAPLSDACSLLTQAQVSDALGIPVSAGQHLSPDISSTCRWGQQDLDSKGVSVSIYTQVGSLAPVDRFNSAKTPVHGITKTPVRGVGDDAISITTPGSMLPSLTVRKGASVFVVHVYGFPPDQIKAKEETLARGIVSKL